MRGVGAKLGANPADQLQPVPVLSKKAIERIYMTGNRSAFGLLSDGNALGWGANTSLQLGVGDDKTYYTPIAKIFGDKIPLFATLESEPYGSTSTLTTNATIAGTNITQYKYKVGDNTADCTTATDYSAAIPIATPLTADLSSIADGTIKLCVVGGDANNVFQDYALATEASWQKIP